MYSAIIVGTGFSGLCMAIHLKRAGIDDFLMLEKAKNLGGTWRDNTYPGAECDIPSALYSYSFEPYPFWDYKWSHQDQILDYLHRVASKHDLLKHIRFDEECVEASFDHSRGEWYVKIKNGSIYQCRNLISAVGQLHHPCIPKIDGKGVFEGISWHSAQWRHDIDISDSNVGVIGSAASAIQLIPELAEQVTSLHIFQRTANWIFPKPDRPYRNWEKSLRRWFPLLLKWERLKLWLTGGVLFFLMGQNKWTKKLGEWKTKRFIERSIKDPETRKKCIPNYPIGAKRILFSDRFYATLNRDNVHLHTDGIRRMTPEGIKTNKGDDVHLDCVVYATGFLTNPFLKGLEIKGLDGQSLHEFWKEEEINYLGMVVPGFPNFFMLYGPNTNLGHNSIIIMSEAQSGYIAECIKNMTENDWRYLNVKSDVAQSYYEYIQNRLGKMAWSLVDKSWYKVNGRIANNWPGRTWEYMTKTRKVAFSDFHIQP